MIRSKNKTLSFFNKELIFKLLILFLFLITNNSVLAEEKINAGIINGLWYSRVPFFAGETVKIYTAIQNQSDFDIEGKIQFLDEDLLIGEKDFLAKDGSFIQEWIDWDVSQGYHYISIKIVEAKKIKAGKEPESISLNLDFLGVDEKFADLDTDGDRVGNEEDLDDDNDGVEDKIEIVIGSNSLVVDTDNDGRNDGDEINEGTDPLVFNEKEELLPIDQKEKIIKAIAFVRTQTSNIVEKIVEIIEEEKEKTEKEIELNSSKPIFEKSFALVNTSFYSLTIPEERVPTWSQVYNYFLGANLYVFKRPYLLVLFVLIGIRIVWKVRRN